MEVIDMAVCSHNTSVLEFKKKTDLHVYRNSKK